MAFYGGPGLSDYIEPSKGEFVERRVNFMSDFELLSLVIMLLALVAAVLKEAKK